MPIEISMKNIIQNYNQRLLNNLKIIGNQKRVVQQHAAYLVHKITCTQREGDINRGNLKQPATDKT